MSLLSHIQIYVAAITILVTVPVNLLITTIFQKVRPAKKDILIFRSAEHSKQGKDLYLFSALL